jgi:excisionase family DNA binding protein
MPIDSKPAIDLLTIPEAAELLKISVSGMRRLQQRRRISFIKVGGSIRFARQDLLSFVQKNRAEAIGT